MIQSLGVQLTNYELKQDAWILDDGGEFKVAVKKKKNPGAVRTLLGA